MIATVWITLVLALIVTLLACAWMLVRKFIRLLKAFSELLVTPAILDGVHRGEPEERAVPAVLEPRPAVAAQYHERSVARQERRELRRSARLTRARALISAETKALN